MAGSTSSEPARPASRRRMAIDEALMPFLVEDPQSGAARSGQLPSHLDHLAQHRLEVELGDQAPADVNQPAKTMLVQNIAVHSQEITANDEKRPDGYKGRD